MSEPNYDEMNPGIRETVRKLRSWGFDTCDSGDGETRDYDCDPGWPYVAIGVDPPSGLVALADLLAAKLAESGVAVGVQVNANVIDVNDPPPISGVHLEASYSPADGVAVIYLSGLKDKDWL